MGYGRSRSRTPPGNDSSISPGASDPDGALVVRSTKSERCGVLRRARHRPKLRASVSSRRQNAALDSPLASNRSCLPTRLWSPFQSLEAGRRAGHGLRQKLHVRVANAVRGISDCRKNGWPASWVDQVLRPSDTVAGDLEQVPGESLPAGLRLT